MTNLEQLRALLGSDWTVTHEGCGWLICQHTAGFKCYLKVSNGSYWTAPKGMWWTIEREGWASRSQPCTVILCEAGLEGLAAKLREMADAKTTAAPKQP
jgi:hypothetical protein